MPHDARYSPSALVRVRLCPGSPNFVATLPPEVREDTSSPAARAGTAQHLLVAKRLEAWLEGVELPDYPDSLVVDGIVTPITDLMIQQVEQAFFSVTAREDVQKARIGTKGFQVHIEQEVNWGQPVIGRPHKGTADLVILSPRRLTVVDNKFGNRSVEPLTPQLQAYALGAGATVDWDGIHQGISEVELVIVQPSDGPPKAVVMPVEKLLEWREEIKEILLAADKPDAPLVPGETQCRYCPGAGLCPARQKQAVSAFESVLPGAPLPTASVESLPDLTEDAVRQDPESMTPADLAKVLESEAVITAWLKACHRQAQSLAEKGTPIPGWKLVEGRRSRDWNTTDDEELVRKLYAFDMKKKDVVVTRVRSPADLEKLVKAKGITGRRLTNFNKLWRWNPGKPELAPETDTRAEWRAAQFEPVLPNDQPEWY